jgi:FkbM family methyltransferase
MVCRFLRVVFNNRIPHRGSRIEVPPCASGLSGAASLFWGIYESAELRFIDRYLDGAVDVVELGSSIGAVSCVIARKLRADRRLICVEGNPNIIEVLKRNIANNSLGLRTKVIHGAVSYSNQGTVRFSIGSDHLTSRLAHSARAVQTCEVPEVTLSELLRHNEIKLYDLVCDIEGGELAILRSDTEALERCRLLIVELHDMHENGVVTTPQAMVALIEARTKLTLLARYGNVFVFSNSRWSS